MDHKPVDVNDYSFQPGSSKRKSDSDYEEINNKQLEPTNEKFKGGSQNSVDIVKKQCTWHPPIKNSQGIAIDHCPGNNNNNRSPKSKFNNNECVSQNMDISPEKNKLENFIPQGNEELEFAQFSTCTTIYKFNEVFNRYESDKEDISLSSMETLPVDIVSKDAFLNDEGIIVDEKGTPSDNGNEEEIEFLNNEKEVSDEEIEDKLETGSKEAVQKKDELDVIENKSEYEDSLQLKTIGEAVINIEKKLINGTSSKKTHLIMEEDDIQNSMEVHQSFTDKGLCNLEDDNDLKVSEEVNDDRTSISTNLELPSKHADICNNKWQRNEESTNEHNSKSTDVNQSDIRNISCTENSLISDDTFDMSITNSQLAKVEGEISNAFYFKTFNKPSNHQMRIKQEHKHILQKLIKEVDLLNKTIVRATNELKSQLYKANVK